MSWSTSLMFAWSLGLAAIAGYLYGVTERRQRNRRINQRTRGGSYFSNVFDKQHRTWK